MQRKANSGSEVIEITSCQIYNIIYYDNDISDNPTTLVSGEISLMFTVKFKFLRCCSSVIDRHRAGLSRDAKTAETANLLQVHVSRRHARGPGPGRAPCPLRSPERIAKAVFQ